MQSTQALLLLWKLKELQFFGLDLLQRKLWYTVVISDGDAKTISRLNSEHPCGTDIEIQVITFMLILFILWWFKICLHLW